MRATRENWGRMDQQDFQVSSIHTSNMYMVYGGGRGCCLAVSHRNVDKNKSRQFSVKRALHYARLTKD